MIHEPTAGHHRPPDYGRVIGYARSHAASALTNHDALSIPIDDLAEAVRFLRNYIRLRVEDAYVAGWYAHKRSEDKP